jgi:hypothetical protein
MVGAAVAAAPTAIRTNQFGLDEMPRATYDCGAKVGFWAGCRQSGSYRQRRNEILTKHIGVADLKHDAPGFDNNRAKFPGLIKT